MTDVVTFGEAMAALHGAGPLRLGGGMSLTIAGSESNVAIGLARLGHSARWVGRIGSDELGALVLRTLRAENVDVASTVVDAAAQTGLLLFEHRIGDLTRVTYYRKGSAGAHVCWQDLEPALEPSPKLLHVTGITPALSPDAADAVTRAVTSARERGTTVSFDVNFRSRLWHAEQARAALRTIVAAADLLFASVDELPLVSDEVDEATAASRLLAEGVGAVVVKRGAHGARAYTRSDVITVPARRVAVVDVVGAGDAFVAGYLSGYLDGLDIAGCLDRGTVLGAFAVSRTGDWEALPTRDELALLDIASGTTVR